MVIKKILYKRVNIEGKTPRITLRVTIFNANFRKLIAIHNSQWVNSRPHMSYRKFLVQISFIRLNISSFAIDGGMIARNIYKTFTGQIRKT